MVTKDNRLIQEKDLCDKHWGTNSPRAAEALTCLDMLETIINSIPEQTEGELVIIIDNQSMCNVTIYKWHKSGTCTLDSSPTIARIKQIILESTIEIVFQLITK